MHSIPHPVLPRRQSRQRTIRSRLPARSLLAGLLLIGGLGPAFADSLVFRWPAPGAAEVIADVERKGQQARMAFTLKISDTGTGEYRVDYEDVKLMSMNGQDLSSARAQAALPPAVAAVTRALPSFLVGSDGKLTRFLNLDALLETIITHIPEDPPQVTREKLRAVLKDPTVRRQMTSKATEDWNAWVGTWVGQPVLASGERREFQARSRSMGAEIPATGFYEDLGPVLEYPGARRLRLEVTAEGPAFAEAIHQMIAAMGERSGQSIGDLSVEDIKLARRVHRIELVTDPSTLMPHEVDTLVEVTFQVEGEAVNRQREHKHFRFDWD